MSVLFCVFIFHLLSCEIKRNYKFFVVVVFTYLPNGSVVKNPPAKTQFQSLDWEDSLEKEMATYSSILAWGIPRTEAPGHLQPMGGKRIGHD